MCCKYLWSFSRKIFSQIWFFLLRSWLKWTRNSNVAFWRIINQTTHIRNIKRKRRREYCRTLFYRKNDLIFRFNQNIKSHDYQSHQLYIFHSIIKNILNIVYNENTHFDYARYYEIILFNYYIRDLTKYL